MLEYIKSSEIHTLIQANLKSSVKSLLYYFENIEFRRDIINLSVSTSVQV